MINRHRYLLVFALLFVGVAGLTIVLLQRNNGVYVEANSESGFNYGYYYYIPKDVVNRSNVYILVQANNTGTVSDDYEIHKQSAKHLVENSLESLADKLGCALLVPVFDRPQSNELMYTHALDRDTMMTDTGMMSRIDLQLIRMIDDFKMVLNRKGISSKPKVLMNGFSASGTFANRFTALHPDLVQAVATGGINSMPILPLDQMDGIDLIYPIGISDIDKFTGQTFDFDAYAKIPQYIFMGANDDNDTLPYDDAFSSDERNIIINVLGEEMHERWEKSQDIYQKLGCLAEFVLYDNVGHEETEYIRDDIINFFKANMKE